MKENADILFDFDYLKVSKWIGVKTIAKKNTKALN